MEGTAGRQWNRSWRATVLSVALAALLVRLAIIVATPGGGDDMKIYYQYAARALAGLNPYQSGAPVVGDPLDLPPSEVALFSGLLHVWNSPTMLRLWFAATDVAVILWFGLVFRRPTSWRLPMMAFYAFSPVVLFTWVGIAEDKGPYLLLVLLVLSGIESSNRALVWSAAAALAWLRQITLLFALPLLVQEVRTRRRLWAVVAWLGMLGGALALSFVPFWPGSLNYFTRRGTRLNVVPEHTNLMVVLQAAHLYSTWLIRPLLVVANLAVLALQVWKKILVQDAVVFSIAAFFLLLPDTPLDRIAFVAILLLTIVRMTRSRWVWLWVLTTIATVWHLATGTHVQGLVEHLPGASLFRSGGLLAYGSAAFAIACNLSVALLTTFYIRDRLHATPGPSI